jgi:hypothetical protein
MSAISAAETVNDTMFEDAVVKDSQLEELQICEIGAL